MKTESKKTATKSPAETLTTKDGKKLTLDPTTIAGVGRSAILAGLNNEEVMMAISGAFPEFPVEKRAYYARWYRAQLVMLGVLDPRKDVRASTVAIRNEDTKRGVTVRAPATGLSYTTGLPRKQDEQQ